MFSVHKRRPLAKTPVLSDPQKYDFQTREREQILRHIRERPERSVTQLPSLDRFAARLDALRTNPYMFYHGESEEYVAADKERQHKREEWNIVVDKYNSQRLPGLPSSALLSLNNKPAVDPLLLDNIFDDLRSDDFSRGQVRSTVEKVLSRRPCCDRIRHCPTALEPVEQNMIIIKNSLLSIVTLDSSVPFEGDIPPEALVIRLDAIKVLLRNHFEIESPVLVDVLCRELSKTKDGSGAVGYVHFLKLIESFVNGENKTSTQRACFKTFDIYDLEAIPRRDLIALRGSKPSEFVNGQTRPMIKALLDIFCTSLDSNAIDQEKFNEYFDLNENIVAGFLEEILRHLLVVQYKHKRDTLLPVGHAKHRR